MTTRTMIRSLMILTLGLGLFSSGCGDDTAETCLCSSTSEICVTELNYNNRNSSDIMCVTAPTSCEGATLSCGCVLAAAEYVDCECAVNPDTGVVEAQCSN